MVVVLQLCYANAKYSQLTPLEQFALRFLEAENAENFSELLKQQEVRLC